MDISKIRKQIREAREEERRQRRARVDRETPEGTLSGGESPLEADGPPSGPPVLQPEPLPAGSGLSPEEPAEVLETLTPGVPLSPEPTPAEVETLPEYDDETDVDDYLDRDEIQDRTRRGNQIKFLAFRLGDEEYAVNLLEMKEVQLYRAVTRVPRTPSYLLGIMSLRGRVIPVFDLRQRLGIRGEAPLAPRILVFSKGHEPVGAKVDSISGVLTTWTEDILPSLNTLSEEESRFITGVIRTEHRFVSMLNLDELLVIETGP